MFDGLKDRLGKFRSDAEDVAEENAEEVEEAEDEETPESEAPTEPADADTGETPAEADESEAAETAAEAEAEPEASESEAASEAAESAASEAAEADGETDEPESEADSGSSRAGFAARAKSAVRGRVVIDEEDLEDPLWELEMALLESDVEMGVAQEILDQIKADLVGEEKKFTTSTDEVVREALKDALLSVISVDGVDFDDAIEQSEKPVVVIFTGVNGVGKTTSIAKLTKYLRDNGHSSVLANGDTYRAGANQQIEEHAANLDVDIITHEQGGDPTAVIYDAVEYAEANDIDVVLGDTAGRLHTSDDLMQQLEKIGRVVDPDLTVFVDEAVAGQDAVNRAREFNDAVPVDGSILTKADADSQGGAAISIAHVTGKPIFFLGTGQGYDDLVKFDPEALVEDLLGD
ncbi:signal recognition particle-docking protein FtsY [Halocalculus aciditolerans]|uniref:Signal recognition particle receptor FtsY n=1 Tax=Halocalculus aciditolerans TaxID=1383812 RepID=A0A830EYZ8_9EURY|nr:signal recognition particle-docking protein FtsY [Halocalculus aciditolerans]GGL46094.1 signal recognition particle-docking protein FtsY [Halocalculus aciditolerans]